MASATIYSVIETIKENGLHSYAYVKHFLEQLPQFGGPLDAVSIEYPNNFGIIELIRIYVDLKRRVHVITEIAVHKVKKTIE